jgi:hypothetical protein
MAGGGGTDGGTVTVDQACERDEASYCGKFEACAVFALQTLYGDAATCKARDRLWCKASLGVQDTSQTPEGIATCADAVDAQSCDDFNAGVLPDVCKPKPGPRAAGVACSSGLQCESLSCKASPNSTCRVCTARMPNGSACTVSSDCESGRCSQKKCVPQVGEGAACASGVSVCDFSAICLNAVCVKVLKPGAACDPMADACDSGNYGAMCDPQSRTCKAVRKVVGAGQPCGDLPEGPTDCSAFGTCALTDPSATVGTCIAALPDGAPCDALSGYDQCFWPASCQNGTCKVQFSTSPAGCPQ